MVYLEIKYSNDKIIDKNRNWLWMGNNNWQKLVISKFSHCIIILSVWCDAPTSKKSTFSASSKCAPNKPQSRINPTKPWTIQFSPLIPSLKTIMMSLNKVFNRWTALKVSYRTISHLLGTSTVKKRGLGKIWTESRCQNRWTSKKWSPLLREMPWSQLLSTTFPSKRQK